MSAWNAALCEYCWGRMEPDRVPVRVRDADREQCSNCGQMTESGIYVRKAPEDQIFPRRG